MGRAQRPFVFPWPSPDASSQESASFPPYRKACSTFCGGGSHVTAPSPATSSTIFALFAPHGRPRFLGCGWLPAVGSCPALLLPHGPGFEFGGCASAPAPCGQAQAPLAALPLPLRLAVRPLRSVAGAAPGPHGLGRDGAQQVVPLAQELGLAGEAEAAFPEGHPGGVLGGA